MKLSEHKRVKFGHVPGDLNKRWYIRMLESKEPFGVPFSKSYSQDIGVECIKSFRNGHYEKGRAVQRQRDKKEIERQLKDYEEENRP